jgi:hypothetical protein
MPNVAKASKAGIFVVQYQLLQWRYLIYLDNKYYFCLSCNAHCGQGKYGKYFCGAKLLASFYCGDTALRLENAQDYNHSMTQFL